MRQCPINVIVLSLLALHAAAEPPAYGSSSDEFDINSISSYLDDDQSNKGLSYSYSNTYNGQIGAERYKGGPFTFGQKSPINSVVSGNAAYSSPTPNYNQAYSSVSQSSVGDYGSVGSTANTFSANNYDAYSNNNNNPVGGLGTYSSPSYSGVYNSPIALGSNAVPYATVPVKAISSPHSNNLASYSGGVNFNGQNPSYPTQVVGGSSGHIPGSYDTHEGSSFVGGQGGIQSLPHRSPYPYEKPTPIGPPQYVSSYKGSSSPFGSYDSGFSKPSRYPTIYKGFSSGPPSYLSGPSAPTGPLSYKSPYYSDYKNSPTIYYSNTRPQSHYSPYKSPNSFESYSSSPYKFESPRYPRYPGKYTSSRPSYSSRPLVYTTGYKPYGKPSSSPPSYSGLF